VKNSNGSATIGGPTFFENLVCQNLAGTGRGIFSICSANRWVIEAAMLKALRDGSILLIESTSNQVNQHGGYMRKTPADFVAYVQGIANPLGFPMEMVFIGGDHLGPHVWRNEPGESAMAKARELIRQSVLAGYRKIHLDASMHCADDPGDRKRPLADDIVSARQADLCLAAETAHGEMPAGTPPPVYVIGTEVPIPGGEQSGAQAPEVTQPKALAKTLEMSRMAFHSRGLESAWARVIAVVVQPGVEFGDSQVFSYDRGRARELSLFAENDWKRVFEAHSTDYQAPEKLGQMVEDHFAILKVGPALTFSFREAVFALAAMEEEWLGKRKGVEISKLRSSLDQAMLENPVYWAPYHQGDDAALEFSRKYSYSDRSRYYWPIPQVEAALQILLHNLGATPLPLSLVSQFMPIQYLAIREGQIANQPEEMIHHKIGEVLGQYSGACGA
jgi:D-tagatose-1,6-bisphosphate aldolase subunit GatZ/KbaZ